MDSFDLYPLIGPALRRLPAERAHHLAIAALKAGLVPAPAPFTDPALASEVFRRHFPNPLGLAAGFDKNAEVIDAMLALGFGFVEIGTVTPRPQPGNPPPRMFRLLAEEAMINRLGFNNQGMEAVAVRLAERRRRRRPGVIGVNIGPNRDSPDPLADCTAIARRLAGLADYLVLNVSSPNTPGLRALQREAPLRALLAAVQRAARAAGGTPVLVKIAPDLDSDELEAIARVTLDLGIDGLVVTNTTTRRPPTLSGRHRNEVGGLSGRPLFAPSTAVLAELYRLTEGRLPLIGVGGIASGGDAYAKIRAGASLVQLYTALIYQGPALVNRIKRELLALLRADGFSHIAEAVGTGSGNDDGALRSGTAP